MAESGPGNVDPQLLAAACREMRRPPPGGNAPSAKKQRTDEPDALELVSRFAYEAPKRLQQGARGLLLTCQVRQERTATKEAMMVLRSYLPAALTAGASETAGKSTAAAGSAQDQQGPSHEEPAAAASTGVTAAAAAAAGPGGEAATAAGGDTATGAAPQSQGPFSIVKLGCTGVVLLLLNESKLPAAQPSSAPAAAAGGSAEGGAAASLPQAPFFLTQAVQHFMADVEAKKRPACKHCQRICPLEQTCLFEPGAMKAQVPSLVAAFLAGDVAASFSEQVAQGQPVKYAVGFKNRTTDPRASTWHGDLHHVAHPYGPIPENTSTPAAPGQEQPQQEGSTAQPEPGSTAAATDAAPAAGTAAAGPNSTAGGAGAAGAGGTDADGSQLRSSVLKLLAGAFAEAMPWPLAVDLKQPQLVLLCEVVPAHGQTFAGLSLLPASMCLTKPRICLRSCGQGKQ